MTRTTWSIDGYKLYELQERWIAQHISQHAADHANYGWFVDEPNGTIATKVYGHGVVTIDTKGKIAYEEF